MMIVVNVQRNQQVLGLIQLFPKPLNFYIQPLVLRQNALQFRLLDVVFRLEALVLPPGALVLVPYRDLPRRETELLGELRFSIGIEVLGDVEA